jgi:IS5 family transposase
MEQMSLAHKGFELVTKCASKRKFLDEMKLVILWTELLTLSVPHAPAGKLGRSPFATEEMLRIHLLQQLFWHSDPAMEEPLHYIPLYRKFSNPETGITSLPDESTILRFRHLLEEHELGQQILAGVNAKLIDRGLMLKTGAVVGATLISAPRTSRTSANLRCTKLRRATSGTLA